MTNLNEAGLLLTVSCCLLLLLKEVNHRGLFERFQKLWPTMIQKSNVILIGIFSIGFLVRLWKFGIIPAGLNQDEAMGAVDALALAHHGTDRFGMWLPAHFTAWGYGQMSTLLSYLSVPFIAIFGLNRFTARVPTLIISLLALITLYKLTKIIFGKKAAIVITAFGAVNPWQIMQSRWALDCNMLPHFFLFSVYFLCLAYQKNKKFLYLALVFFGITMYAYGIAWFIVPLFLLITSACLFINRKISLKDLGLAAVVYLVVAWPILGVMIVNVFKLSTIYTPFVTIPYFPYSVRSSDLLFFSPNIPAQLINNFNSTLNIVFQNVDLPWNSIPEYGTYYLFAIPFFFVGLICLLKVFFLDRSRNGIRKSELEFTGDKRINFMMIIFWFLVALLSGLIVNGVNINRINIIFYPIIIICGYGIYSMIKTIKLLIIPIVLVFTIGFIGFNQSYFGSHSQVIANEFYDGFGEALAYIKNLEYEKIYITSWTQSDNSMAVSEILTLFHHQIDAIYFQGRADSFSKDHRKLLPYHQRYQFVQMKNMTINSKEEAVYLVNNSERFLFDSKKFQFVSFAKFSVVRPILKINRF